MSHEDVSDRSGEGDMPNVLQGTLDPLVAPRSFFSDHSQCEFGDLLHDTWEATALAYDITSVGLVAQTCVVSIVW